MDTSWQVMIRNDFSMALSIIVYRMGGEKGAQCYTTENGVAVIKDFNPHGFVNNDELKPFFVVPYEMEIDGFSEKLLQALVDKGIQLPDKNFAQGKLEATEKHLEDMRKLVFDAG